INGVIEQLIGILKIIRLFSEIMQFCIYGRERSIYKVKKCL
ncbi:unnamed protein product, partial [marine sediment metagenome]